MCLSYVQGNHRKRVTSLDSLVLPDIARKKKAKKKRQKKKTFITALPPFFPLQFL